MRRACFLYMNKTTPENWNAYWNEYEKPGYVNHTPRLIETIKRHVQLAGAHILEVGAGTGGNSFTLAKFGACVTALDFAEAALYRAQSFFSSQDVNLGIVQGDTLNLPFPSGYFDLIFHQGLLEHFLNPAVIVHEQKRVLAKGGFLLVDVPQRFNLFTLYKHALIRAGRWPYGGWEREFSLRELTNLLKSEGFEIVDIYGRGYYPRPFGMLRNLQKIETKVFKHRVLSQKAWIEYDAFWEKFESSSLGCNSLQCLGVLAQLK